MDEKFGKLIIEGKIVDLDNASEEELEKYIKILEQKKARLTEEIDEILEINKKND